MSLQFQIEATTRTLHALLQIEPQITQARELVLSTLQQGGKLLICGNGGSAAEAAHFSTELVGRYARKRRSLPAIALSSDGSLLSCIGNDYGYEHVFSRQVEGLASKGDLLVSITSSGNSANILCALETARRMQLKSISMLGREGGKARGLADVDLIIPGDSGRSAQEAHLFLIHYFCEAIDQSFA